MAVYEYDNIEVETPDVVSDEVLNVYIPDASYDSKGIAKFNREQFDVSDDSEVSLSAIVLGNIDKKLDKVTESSTGHGQVYAIYGDGRENPQTMWDLDNTGTYSGYYIPNSDGRGYLNVKDPINDRNPVNKQFLDEKLKGKLDSLGKTSGVFPAAYVREQGFVAGHDYGKSIEVNPGATPYTIPVRSADGTLRTATPKDDNDAVNLSYLKNYDAQSLYTETGTGVHSLKFNVTQNNEAISGATNAFGDGTIAGLKGYYYSDIDFTNKTITLSTAHGDGVTLTGCDYEAGDVLSIVNDIKYDRCCTVTAINGGIITVDSLPFTEIVDGDSAWDAYTIFCVDKPQIGLVDIGIAAFAIGENCKATNSHSFVAGRDNQIIGQYGASVGRDNVSGYASFTAGRNNKYYGQAGAMLGQDNSGIGNKQFSLGFKNQHGNYDQTYSIGYNNKINAKSQMSFGKSNVLNATEDIAIGNNNELNVDETVSAGENIAIGIQNKIYRRRAVAFGYSNTVATKQSTVRTSDFAVALGSNNKVNNNHAGAIGRSNTVNNYGAWALGIGLTSTYSYQTLLGAYNMDSGLYENTARVIIGGGSAESHKTLATLSDTGALHLAGSWMTLRSSAGKDITLNAEGIQGLNNLNRVISAPVGEGTMYQSVSIFTKEVQMNDNLTIVGNLNVTGTTTVQDVKNIAVEDLTITLSKNAPIGSGLAGIIVPDYNGMSQPGGLVFDDTGTAYVGDVSVTSNGMVTQGNAKPIAVRSDVSEWSENSLPQWDSDLEGFKPSGFTTDSFVQKSTNTDGYYLYAHKKGTEALVQYSTAAGNGRIPMYDVGGVLRVGTAVDDNDAVNLKQLTDALATKADTATLSNYYPLEVEESYDPQDGTARLYGFSVDNGVFKVEVSEMPYPNAVMVSDSSARLYAMNGFNDDATVDSEYAIDPYILPNVDTVKRSLDKKLDITDATRLRHWVATLANASDPDVNGGQVEFWSTGTPNSTVNPTNFSDLFAKRVGKALVRNIDSTGIEYFVYMLGYAGQEGVMYHTAYPFTEMNTSGVHYDSVTLSELT